MKSLALSEDKALCLCPDNVSVAVLLACCDWVVPLTSKRGYLQNAISCDLITIWPAKVIFPWWWTLWPIWRSRLSTSFRVAASPMLPALCVSDAAFSGDLKAAQASASTPRAQSAAATAGSAVAHSKLRSTTTREAARVREPPLASLLRQCDVCEESRCGSTAQGSPQISVALHVDETGFRETCEDVGVDLAMGFKHKPELAKLPKE